MFLALGSSLTALVLGYDTKRAMWPRIEGERPWRQRRAMATSMAVVAFSVLHQASGPAWVRPVALLAFAVACAAVLWCSVPLKRLVAQALRTRLALEDSNLH
jgi:protein-S-isoprenylcysteine O-methyltransferase Ste14